jgi:hypothetical protein
LPPAVNRPSGGSASGPAAANKQQAGRMFDLAMLAAGIGFFALSVLYVLACEKM